MLRDVLQPTVRMKCLRGWATDCVLWAGLKTSAAACVRIAGSWIIIVTHWFSPLVLPTCFRRFIRHFHLLLVFFFVFFFLNGRTYGLSSLNLLGVVFNDFKFGPTQSFLDRQFRLHGQTQAGRGYRTLFGQAYTQYYARFWSHMKLFKPFLQGK